jgi:hypothetical protein
LDKKEELTHHEGAARFLIVSDNTEGAKHFKAGFVHFRFTLRGEAVGVSGALGSK